MPAKISVCAPFDDVDADIIFRSSDDVDFRLYKVIIAKASPVIRGMLTLPDVPGTPPSEPQVVQMTEKAQTLEHVFRLCCPVEPPADMSIDDAHAAGEAARKYEMACVNASLQMIVKAMLPDEPLRIYAIAYLFGWEDVARKAAEHLLDHPGFHIPPSPPPEFCVLPSTAVYAVHVYRQKCVDAILGVMADNEWILNGEHERKYCSDSVRGSINPNTWVWATCHSSNCTEGSIASGLFLQDLSRPNVLRVVAPAKWFSTHVRSLMTALSSRPSGRTIRSYFASSQVWDALREAARCPTCATKAYADLLLFNDMLGRRIDDALSKVHVDLPFCKNAP